MFGIKGDTIAKLGTISQVRIVGYEPRSPLIYLLYQKDSLLKLNSVL